MTNPRSIVRLGMALVAGITLAANASAQQPRTRSADVPTVDSLAALVRLRFRLDLQVLFVPGDQPTRGTAHVWNTVDSLVAPVEFSRSGDPPSWGVRVDDPQGLLEPYLLASENRGAASDERWRTCRADRHSPLVCAALGHEYNYRELMMSRGAPADLRELAGDELEGALAQLLDSTQPSVIPMETDDWLRQAAYARSTGVLVYYHAADTLFTWLVSSDGIVGQTATLVDRSTLTRNVAAFREELASGAGASDAPTRSEPIGVRRNAGPELDLPAILLPPDIAEPVTKLERLIVVPVLNLGTIPFAALRTTAGYMLDGATVSVAPSLWDLFSSYPRRDEYRSALVVGNPDFTGEREWRLPNLPGAEAEANAVASLFDSLEVLSGAEATESNVSSAPRADILHFATHGISNQDDPLQGSFLALAGGGRLTAAEIQERAGWADLVVMSACQTGLGMTDLGGIIGLARAFQIAGTPDVVMSLWSVDDEATAELMREFYGGLRSGWPPADALRWASIAVRDRYPTPSVWAAFTILSLQQVSVR